MTSRRMRSGAYIACATPRYACGWYCRMGGVNIYTLAKNAGTSVNQIERFYAKRLPISKELMENLQSFGR